MEEEAGMEIRFLGSTGIKVSALCMGTMQFGWTANEKTSLEVLNASEESGINFIDTADVYSRWVDGNPGGVAETIVGKWLRASAGRRERTVVATKVRGEMGPSPNDQGLSRLHILRAVEASLRRLGVESIDLYQVHWPDRDVPIEETLRALDDLVHQGKVRHLGCSNFRAWEVMQALWTSDRLGLERFGSLQPHYNLLNRAEYERELEDVCLRYGLGVIPYSPLAGGFLTGKYRRGEPAEPGTRGAGGGRVASWIQESRSWEVLAALQQVAEGRGATASQVSLAWLLGRKGITSPIIGPRSISQLQDNVGAAELHLTADEMRALEEASAWE
jgi:aryl-alcohol dehydrogenase-like predicted oxidoreductase